MTEAEACWDARASLGQRAGTQDWIAEELERRAILRWIKPGDRVLDAGCGNGALALRIAEAIRETMVDGIDRSLEMVTAAQTMASTRSFAAWFSQADVRDLDLASPAYDVVLTERLLINLGPWEEQRRAALRLAGLVCPGGLLLLCENSQDGVEELSRWRAAVGLPAIKPPWHNRYIRDSEMRSLGTRTLRLEAVEYPTSTYALLSRIAQAKLAHDAGREPDYGHVLNRLALELPEIGIGRFGQTRLWVFRRLGWLGALLR